MAQPDGALRIVPPVEAPAAGPVVRRLRLRDGRQLCVRQWPGARDQAVVVLHGLLDSSEGWARLGERLPGLCTALDLPGFGQSDPAARGSIAGYAADVIEALDQLDLPRFTLIGHSLGGAVAAAVAELIPDKVGALVLLAPAGFGRLHLAEAISVPALRDIAQVGLRFVLGNRVAVTAGYVTMVANGSKPQDDVVDRITARGRSLVDGTREGMRAVVTAGRSADAFHRRAIAYPGPVFALWGDRDRLVAPDHRHALGRALPQARIELWHEMGHHPLAERFDDLVRFVERAAGAARPPAACTGARRRRRRVASAGTLSASRQSL